VLGREELDRLAAQKQALLVESTLHRLAVQAEFQSLRSATAWVREAADRSGELTPLLLILAPLAGFLLAKGSRRPDSWLSRALAAAKWIGPLYGLWKHFSAGRRQADPANPPPP
jgi:hypothetical protein